MPDFNKYGIGNIIVYVGDLLKWWLGSIGLPEPWPTVIVVLIGIVTIATIALLIPVFTIWLERKLAARFQDRQTAAGAPAFASLLRCESPHSFAA